MTIPPMGRYRLRSGLQRVLLKDSRVVGGRVRDDVAAAERRSLANRLPLHHEIWPDPTRDGSPATVAPAV